MRDRRHHAIHDSEHASHGKERGEQQTPGPALLEIVSSYHRVFLARLDVPKYHEEHDRNNNKNGNQSPIRFSKCADLIDSKIDRQERDAERDHTSPVHLGRFFGGALLREGEHENDRKSRNCRHHDEHRTEAEVASKPAT